MEQEKRYNNRQFERMLDQQSNDLKEHIRLIIEPLTVQVKKTNGRVTKLEKAIIIIVTGLTALGISNPQVVSLVSALLS